MKKQPVSKEMQAEFVQTMLPFAKAAGGRFTLNPVVILAQAVLESGWGTSTLANRHHNFFGITAYGKPNDYWNGCAVELSPESLKFRKYRSPEEGFMDYGRLISTAYKPAAAMSFHPEAFAKEIAYSRYITEENGDNREAYRKALVQICRMIETFINQQT